MGLAYSKNLTVKVAQSCPTLCNPIDCIVHGILQARILDWLGLKLNIQKTKIMASGPITSWERDGETVETVSDFIFLGSKITADGDCNHEIKRLTPWQESYDQPRQHIKKQRFCFVNKGPPSQGYGFSSGHVWM